jgi:hypothetical protein
MAKSNPFALSPERQAERDRSDKMWASAAKTLRRAKRSGIISSAGDLLKKNDRALAKREKNLGTPAGDRDLRKRLAQFEGDQLAKKAAEDPNKAAKDRMIRKARNNASSRSLQEIRKSGNTGDINGLGNSRFNDDIKKGADARLAKAKELKTQRAADRTDRAAIKEKLGYNKPVDPVIARLKSLGAEFNKNQAEIDTKNKADLDAHIKGKAARVNAERAATSGPAGGGGGGGKGKGRGNWGHKGRPGVRGGSA